MGGGLFITGTDTGVGKTLIACGLAALLTRRGYKVGVMKPVETGCAEKGGALFAADAFRLQQAAGCTEPLERVCPYRLKEPLAPSVAAERSGVQIDIGHIATLYSELRAQYDITLVEGAGGLLVPLLPHYTYADLASLLKLPVLVVVANRLGAINHLLLTLEHASCRGLSVLGYVLNQPENHTLLAAETNVKALTLLTSTLCLGDVPYLPSQPEGASIEQQRAILAALFEERMNLTFWERALLKRGP
ncbi:MAG: dethiobiotin synthase [Candidatus Binatia bacterium]